MFAALVIINAALVLAAVIMSIVFSNHINEMQKQSDLDNFANTIESMKQLSINYLKTERGYAADWASYIDKHNMTLDEALDFIRETNVQSDITAHIVDMETFEAHSTYLRNGDDSVDCYAKIGSGQAKSDRQFVEKMRYIYASGSVGVLGKYKIRESQRSVISVGTRVSLKTDSGKKEYLLLRTIPVETMKENWIFPLEYQSAEVGLITSGGDYVIQSAAMKSENFIELIRAYNFSDNYNGVDELAETLSSSSKGMLELKDSRGEDCFWYFSELSEGMGVCILGYIPQSSFVHPNNDRVIIFIICGTLLLLILFDGMHIILMYRKVRNSAMLAERASQAKTQFLSSMSHDIRTPMNAVIGMTELAKQHIDDPEYVMKCLNKVSASGDRLLTLINDILDISKVESGKMAVNPAVFSVTEAADDLIGMVRPMIKDKKLEFSYDCSGIKYEYLVGDELRINQICMNLLTNAVKYTESGGKIGFALREEDVHDNKDNVWLVITVSDTGIGMTEEFQQNMYDIFSRASDSRIDNIQGSGLGLAIVKQITDLLNGSVMCRSTPGNGTEFTVSIELRKADGYEVDKYIRIDSASDSETASEFNGMNVLVAEDNDLNWEIVSEFLKEDGVSCDRAKDGRECVDMINAADEGRYDLIFMDVQMPVMNGRDAAREIRKSEKSYVRDIPIYAMTADAFAEDIQACIDSGMDGHISKPVDMKKIHNVLHNVLNKKIS